MNDFMGGALPRPSDYEVVVEMPMRGSRKVGCFFTHRASDDGVLRIRHVGDDVDLVMLHPDGTVVVADKLKTNDELVGVLADLLYKARVYRREFDPGVGGDVPYPEQSEFVTALKRASEVVDGRTPPSYASLLTTARGLLAAGEELAKSVDHQHGPEDEDVRSWARAVRAFEHVASETGETPS